MIFVMISNFQREHIVNFLQAVDESSLDLQLSRYLRANKSVGSKDRKVIGDTIYELIRWRGLIDAHLDDPITWEKRLEVFLTSSRDFLLKTPTLKAHEKVSFPKEFYQLLLTHLGETETDKFCLNSNLPAPLTVRTNLLKISRDDLYKQLAPQFPVSLCEESKAGILFHKKINFFELPEFKAGYFEIQDEASQIVTDHVEAGPGDEVLDFCAGGRGKSLGIAPKMKGKGQIFLHDIRKKPLQMAKVRLNRAGIQNMQIVLDLPSRLKNRMNWLLLDVPCSGSGTWRRNPDQKWKFSRTLLDRLVAEQRTIFENALPFLNPKGKIVYATCSVLPEENEEQISYFMNKYNLSLVKPFFKSLPKPGEKDGFFAAVLSY